jgi:hypothetical protein
MRKFSESFLKTSGLYYKTFYGPYLFRGAKTLSKTYPVFSFQPNNKKHNNQHSKTHRLLSLC